VGFFRTALELRPSLAPPASTEFRKILHEGFLALPGQNMTNMNLLIILLILAGTKLKYSWHARLPLVETLHHGMPLFPTS